MFHTVGPIYIVYLKLYVNKQALQSQPVLRCLSTEITIEMQLHGYQ